MDGDSLILFTFFFFFFTFLATLWSPRLPHLSSRSSSSIWKPFRHLRNVRSKFLLPLIVFQSFSLSTAFLFQGENWATAVCAWNRCPEQQDRCSDGAPRKIKVPKQKMSENVTNFKQCKTQVTYATYVIYSCLLFSRLVCSFVRLVFVLFWGVWAAWWTALSRQQVLKWPRPRRKSSKIERFGRRESRKKSTEWKWMKVNESQKYVKYMKRVTCFFLSKIVTVTHAWKHTCEHEGFGKESREDTVARRYSVSVSTLQ